MFTCFPYTKIIGVVFCLLIFPKALFSFVTVKNSSHKILKEVIVQAFPGGPVERLDNFKKDEIYTFFADKIIKKGSMCTISAWYFCKGKRRFSGLFKFYIEDRNILDIISHKDSLLITLLPCFY